MYYDNKSAFYLKQYGPAVVVSVVSLALISSGVYIYLKSTGMVNPFAKETEVVQVVENVVPVVEAPVVVAPVVEEVKPVVITPAVEVVKYFESLPILEKSKEVNVTNINENGNINIEVDGDKLEITMIGVDFSYSKELAVEKMKADLLNKKVTIAFDKVKTENGKTYAYVFKDKLTYNATLLKTGLVTLKTERKNTQLNTELSAAQAFARENSLGVWKK